jgi:hypothetical protein
MRRVPAWVIEFIKLLGWRRLHPVVTECPPVHDSRPRKAGSGERLRNAILLESGSIDRPRYMVRSASHRCIAQV